MEPFCVAMTPGICVNQGRKTGLEDGLLLRFLRLAWKGSKSGVKPLHSGQSWEMLWHFGQG